MRVNKRMWSGIFLVVGLLVMVLVVVLVPQSSVTGDGVLNKFVFRSPGANRYSEHWVNLWVPKVWRTEDPTQRIPCRMEYGYRDAVPKAERKLIVYSHGNAEDLMSCAQFLRELSERLAMDVVTWDYTGYGLNALDSWEQTVDGVNASLQTVLDALLAQGYRLSNVLLWGYSLGTGPSTALAASLSRQNRALCGLILFGAYASILEVVKDHAPAWVVPWFSERWNSQEAIAEVTCPILLLHGQSDGLIPAHHSERLHRAAPAHQAQLVLFPNVGHTQFSWAEAMKEVCRWLQEKHIHRVE